MAEKNPKKERYDEFKSRAEQLRSEYKGDKEAFLQKYKREETPMLMAAAAPQFGFGESRYNSSSRNSEEIIKKFNEIKG